MRLRLPLGAVDGGLGHAVGLVDLARHRPLTKKSPSHGRRLPTTWIRSPS